MGYTKIQKFKYNSYKEFLVIRELLSGKGTPRTWRCGASSVAAILNQSQYKDSFQFFYEACDYWSAPHMLRPETHRGQVQETMIYNEYWKYINPDDPSFESYVNNWHGEKKVYRKAVNEKHIYFNPKYPFSYASPDFSILKNPYSKNGALELKSPTSRAIEKYEAGIPREYEIQIQQQMMIMNKKYGEVFMLRDSTYPELFCYEPDKILQEQIESETHDFHSLVMAGKEIVYSNMSFEEKEQALGEIAPEPTGLEGTTAFLKEHHKPENAKVSVDGTDEQLQTVLDYLVAKKEIKDLGEVNLQLENKIRSWFTGLIGVISFGPGIDISYKTKLNIPMRILDKISVGGEV